MRTDKSDKHKCRSEFLCQEARLVFRYHSFNGCSASGCFSQNFCNVDMGISLMVPRYKLQIKPKILSNSGIQLQA